MRKGDIEKVIDSLDKPYMEARRSISYLLGRFGREAEINPRIYSSADLAKLFQVLDELANKKDETPAADTARESRN